MISSLSGKPSTIQTSSPSPLTPTPLVLQQQGFFCAKLVHTDKVRMKNRESSAVASFSTSFTFSITQEDQASNRSGWQRQFCGFSFTLVSENITSLFQSGYSEFGQHYLAVEFDTYNSYMDEDPIDNHIGVDINCINSTSTYNVCGGQRTSGSFPWTGRTYSAWIDYNGSTRSLDVWFANGSLADGVIKPTGSGLIVVSGLDLADIFGEYMYVGFLSNSGSFLESYEILSWNFASRFSENEMGALTPTQSWRFSKRILVISAACGAILFITCLLGYWTRQSHSNRSSELESDLFNGLRRLSFKELKKATNNFNKRALLGKGGSGSVYKGTLRPSGTVVAVKRLKHDSEHVERDFVAEVSSISQIRHRNLVHLQGWCYEGGHVLLVFDYMSNGSLCEWFFPSRRRYPLDPKYKKFDVFPWELRISVLAGVAAAVEHLHEDCVQCVLHRDIKSSNVMLDANFNLHLGDFGLGRLMDHEKLEKTTMVGGTLGYMAPEMHYTGKATKESDVYSFGVLMLEVVCGRRPVNLQVEDPDENFLLMQNVWRGYEGGNILSAVDPNLLFLHSHQPMPSSSSTGASYGISERTNSICEPEVVTELSSNGFPEDSEGAICSVGDVARKIVPLLHLGLQCCLSEPECRPSMRVVKQVILQLQGSTAEDSMSILSSMPPLPSTMPVCGSLVGVLRSAGNAPLDEMEESLMRRNDTLSVMRRRFPTY